MSDHLLASPHLRRVEHHMSTAVTLGGSGVSDDVADGFFAAIAELEDLLSRFRPGSQISRFARGDLALDDAAAAVREVLARCDALRDLTGGDFEFEPRRRSGNDDDLLLDVNAVAKGWIVDEAAGPVAMASDEFFVNAGGDVLASRRLDGSPWRVGIQHPTERDAVLGVVLVEHGAVATSGTYERGAHIRSAAGPADSGTSADAPPPLVSVTVVGPDLATADGLSTAVFAAGVPVPSWWSAVGRDHGLLTTDAAGRTRWVAPTAPNRRWVWEPAVA